MQDLKLLRDFGQPNLNFTIDRQQAARFGINVADIQDAIQTAVGGNAVSQVLQGEQRYDVVVRYQEPYRNTQEAIANVRLLSPSGERVSLAQLTKVEVKDGAYDIYREGNSRYVAVTFNVRGRDLGSTVEEAIKPDQRKSEAAAGLSRRLVGRIRERKAGGSAPADHRAADHPRHLHHSLHHVQLGEVGAAHSHQRRHGAASAACWRCWSRARTSACPRASGSWRCSASRCRPESSCSNTSTSFARGATPSWTPRSKARCLRLRPIMMTMLVATLGLLPAALSHAIGSDSQRPFAIVIVGGLIADLVMSIVLLPTLYVWFASERDQLPEAEESFES